MIITRRKRLRALLAMSALTASAALVLSGCAPRASDTPAEGETPAAAASCIDTSGDTIKLGFLNSHTGGMAISEKTVSNVLHMAADEINADGGILGKQIEYIQEDGRTDWPTSRRRPRSCSPRTASPRSSAAGPRPPARPSSRSSRRTTAVLLPGAVRGPRGLSEHLLHRRDGRTSRSSRRWTSSPRRA